MGILDTTYARLPLPAQHAAISAFGLYWYWQRFGPGYRRFVREYARRNDWTANDWQAWQQQQLRELLPACARHVPYYRARWSAAEVRAAEAGRLSELPLLPKDDVRANPNGFMRDDLSQRGLVTCYTSGSTGTPVNTIWTRGEMRRAIAVREARSARWAGVSFGLPRATFSGRIIEPSPASDGPFYRFNLVERQVYFSSFHLRPQTVMAYVAALERHHTAWLTGYTAMCFLMARLMIEQKLRPPRSLRAVVTTSEKLTPVMRDVIHRAFRCPVFEEYGSVENVFLATECEAGRLHVSPDVGVIEILRPDGTPCVPDEPGEVVATALMRVRQPLVRYRLGDLASWDSQPCPCGRQMPVMNEVLGRIEDAIVCPDGRRVVNFYGVFMNVPHLKEAQIVQELPTQVRIRVVTTPDFGPAEEKLILERMQSRLSPEMQLVVEPTAEIARTKAGKFQGVVNRLRDRNMHEVEHFESA